MGQFPSEQFPNRPIASLKIDKEIYKDKSIVSKYELHRDEFIALEKAEKVATQQAEAEAIVDQIEAERNNFKFTNQNHILVLNGSVKYVMTGDSVEIENGDVSTATEKLRILVASTLIK